MGEIVAICLSERKGTAKKPVNSALLREGHGFENDAHAGNWHRQVSLIALERIEAFRSRGATAPFGCFGENLVVRGIDFSSLPPGTRFASGNALLELTQIGKECHTRCQIFHTMGECIMPTQGVFAKVLRGGRVCAGDSLDVVASIDNCGRVHQNGERQLLTREKLMDFQALAEAARTCRRFEEDRPLGTADLEWLVECARLAPSARNAQTLRFTLVSRGETCQRLFSLTRWAGALKDWGGPHPGERPTAFIAILMPESGNHLVCYDVGIAAQTIQLAATSRGWGCCMIQTFDHAAVPELLKIPSGMKVALVLGLGVAREIRRVAPVPADGSLAYWRDAEGVHHVPKRDLSELVAARY
ncbi:MAG: nitroreductase family protein [Desulfovibrio sp.]|jgi:MOSC domain-containing protein YiiM|nr:nitroreductase family protein [Desulfovibrio sp.]